MTGLIPANPHTCWPKASTWREVKPLAVASLLRLFLEDLILDTQEEGHENVAGHGPQRAAWEELVRPTLFLVSQDVQTHAVVVLEAHAVLSGDLFCYGYTHG